VCIDQDDPEDISAHLACMHTVYARAEYCIGLLDFEISDQHQMAALSILRIDIDHKERHPFLWKNLEGINVLIDLFRAIRKDKWFTRTWVLQERFSARFNVYLTFRLSNELQNSGWKYLEECSLYWEGSTFSYKGLDVGLSVWTSFMAGTHHKYPPEVQIAVRVLHSVIRDIITEFTMLTVNLKAPERYRFENMKEGFPGSSVFQEMKTCQNSKVSDRVAIFANIMQYKTRIDTALLSSYSMSILQLLMVNHTLPCILVAADDDAPRQWFQSDLKLGDLIHRIVEVQDLVRNGAEHCEEDLRRMKSLLATVSDIQLEE
jgi:hypothetical protein